ncbi:MAG: hypothetical protein R2941_08355 [Desulfobacterales bacterium]
MTEEITIENVAAAIAEMDSRPLAARIGRFVKASLYMEGLLGSADNLPEKSVHAYEKSYAELMQESSAMLSRSTVTVSRIVNYQFRVNGQSKGIPEIDRLTESWFRKMRKHEMELLSGINDEIRMIRAGIRQYRKMQEVMKTHSPALSKAGNMMSVIRERIARRPTTLLHLESHEEKIRQLNQTFREMNEYENRQHFRLDSGSSPACDAFALCRELGQGAFADISVRQTRVTNSISELKKGGKLLFKLAKKGYSPFMKRALEELTANHEERIRLFQQHVMENRSLYFLQPSLSS